MVSEVKCGLSLPLQGLKEPVSDLAFATAYWVVVGTLVYTSILSFLNYKMGVTVYL